MSFRFVLEFKKKINDKNIIFYHLLFIIYHLLLPISFHFISFHLHPPLLQIHVNCALAHSVVVFLDEIVYHIGCNMKWEFDHQCVLFLE